MKKIAFAALGLLTLSFGSGFMLTGHCQTQLEMNGEANGRADVADRNLNVTYKKIVHQYQSNQNFLTKLVAAEKAWIAYRDAYLKSVFPEENQYMAYGNMFPMCRATWLASIAEDRTKLLKNYLTVKNAPSDVEALFKNEEKRLNDVWPKALKIYDGQYVKHLRLAEMTWLAYRDADASAFAALVSAADAPNLVFARKAVLDNERTKELLQWVNGVDEEDACTGCIPRSGKKTVQTPSVNPTPHQEENRKVVAKSPAPSRPPRPYAEPGSMHPLGDLPGIAPARWREIQAHYFEMTLEQDYRPFPGDICYVAKDEVSWLSSAARDKYADMFDVEMQRTGGTKLPGPEFNKRAIAQSNGQLIMLTAGTKVRVLEGICEPPMGGFKDGKGKVQVLDGAYAGKVLENDGIWLQNYYRNPDDPMAFLRDEADKRAWQALTVSRTMDKRRNNDSAINSEEFKQHRLLEF